MKNSFKILIVLFFTLFLVTGCLEEEIPENISDVSLTYHIGDTVSCGDYSIKLESYQTKKKGDRIDSYSVVDDPQWVAITLTYTNTGTEDFNLYKHIYLINGNGEKIDPATLYYKVWKGEHLDSATLVPGGTKTGYVPFANTTKDNVEDITVKIACSSSYNDKSTFTFKLTNQ